MATATSISSAGKNDLLKIKGERVSPKEIELFLNSIAGVLQSAVIGIRDATSGQRIKAHVVTDPGAGLTADAILKQCRENLEPILVPSQIAICTTLPVSAHGKLEKKALA